MLLTAIAQVQRCWRRQAQIGKIARRKFSVPFPELSEPIASPTVIQVSRRTLHQAEARSDRNNIGAHAKMLDETGADATRPSEFRKQLVLIVQQRFHKAVRKVNDGVEPVNLHNHVLYFLNRFGLKQVRF